MKILGKIVRTLMLSALAVVAALNSHEPSTEQNKSMAITQVSPTSTAVVDFEAN